jgi:hypothetical protein
VVISGTVLDKSPGDQGSTTNPTARTDFPTNVPCISDNSMATYMQYLYEQQPIDGLPHSITVTGVPVSIDAVDPNGNSIHIATVTSNAKGTFGYTWTAPNILGQYTIQATFAGDDSYGSSSANAYAAVVSPTATAATTTQTTGASVVSSTDIMTYIAVAAIAIIIAIAIVGVVLVRIMRRTTTK